MEMEIKSLQRQMKKSISRTQTPSDRMKEDYGVWYVKQKEQNGIHKMWLQNCVTE